MARKFSLTGNGALQYASTFDAHLDFFSKAGSLFVKKAGKTGKAFYGNQETAIDLFQKMWKGDENSKVLAMQLLMWVRDARGGAGNRSGARAIISWLGDNDTQWIAANVGFITECGRWDDLTALYGTKAERIALATWAKGIAEGNGLACKWADRKDYKLRGFMGMKPKTFRQTVVAGTKVVETPMCAKKWDAIDFSKVPSVAHARYAKAFERNCGHKFEKFVEAAEAGEVKINASVVFPHDLVRGAKTGSMTADAQWNSLPNWFEGSGQRVISIADTSGSMSSLVSGSVAAVDISQALALYCSDKISSDSPFHRKFMQFCDEGHLVDWTGMKFSEVVNKGIWNRAVGTTDIHKALMTLLALGTKFGVSKDKMPTTLLIVSDMQFNQGCRNNTPVKDAVDHWIAAGYDAPNVVYWNVMGYCGSPDTKSSGGVGLVSGFSPAILKSIFGGEDFTPLSIMAKALEKYEVNIP